MSKRKFKVGDKVVIKPESVYGPKGVVGTVTGYYSVDKKYTVKFTNGFTHDFRGVELDAYTEPKKVEKKETVKPEVKEKESEFKVGDRIEYKHNDGKTYKGVIVEVDTGLGGGLCLCKLENFFGHNGKHFSKKNDGYDTCDHWFCIPYELKKIEEPKEEPKNTIVIYQRDRDVVALDKVTGQKCYAHCHPDDKFDFKTGAKIAFGRLIGEPVEEKTVPKEEPIKYVDRFEKGKTYIFDKETFKHCCGYNNDVPEWVDYCDGKVVKYETKDIGSIGSYLIGCHWCKEVMGETEAPNKVENDIDNFVKMLEAMLFAEIKKVD